MKKKYIYPCMQKVQISGHAILCVSGLEPEKGGNVNPDNNPYEGEFMSLNDDWKI